MVRGSVTSCPPGGGVVMDFASEAPALQGEKRADGGAWTVAARTPARYHSGRSLTVIPTGGCDHAPWCHRLDFALGRDDRERLRDVRRMGGVAVPQQPLRVRTTRDVLAEEPRGNRSARGAQRHRSRSVGELVGQGHHGQPRPDLPELGAEVAPPRWAAAGLLVIALGAGVAPAPAGPIDDKLIPLDRYATPKARALGTAHQQHLYKYSEHVYGCLPWLDVQKASIGFQRPKFAEGDDRYFSTW